MNCDITVLVIQSSARY